MKVLHIGSAGIIMIPFVEFINKNFLKQDHLFLLSPEKDHEIPSDSNVLNLAALPRISRQLRKVGAMYQSEQIVLHGLFDTKLIFLLSLQPWLLKKINWVIWGGDLYDHVFANKNLKWRVREVFKKIVVRRLGRLTTYIRGDYELAKEWYGAKGQWHECIMYPSNLCKIYSADRLPKSSCISILLGNSASQTNNHFDAFEKLRSFSDKDIKIYCPLSYGDKAYADAVAFEGGRIFGNKFIPLRDLMPLREYVEFLANIDVAIFNHERQQAMGNTITLLGLGKTVFMRPEVTPFRTLRDLGIEVRDVSDLSLDKIDNLVNVKRVKDYFSQKRLQTQWQAIFDR